MIGTLNIFRGTPALGLRFLGLWLPIRICRFVARFRSLAFLGLRLFTIFSCFDFCGRQLHLSQLFCIGQVVHGADPKVI